MKGITQLGPYQEVRESNRDHRAAMGENLHVIFNFTIVGNCIHGIIIQKLESKEKY